MATYSFSGTPVFVTVATTATYDLTAFGAQGGNSTAYSTTGGKGAEEGGNFTLTAGEKLEIVVGGVGGSSNYGGGGGGTFVLANTGAGGAFVPLLVAGGGGGAYSVNGGTGTVAASGSGSGGAATGGNFAGGGGSGVKSNGATGPGSGGQGVGGDNLSGGYAGGVGRSGGGNGGFGGGGGGGELGGGGGGGYTGGDGRDEGAGGGGTSFDKGTAIAAQTMAGVQSGNGSLTITPKVACYSSGTLILTSRGEMPVEVLAIGDTVITASGERRPIKWVGHRAYSGRFIAGNHLMLPVTISAGALADNVPHTDLIVSPGHAMLVDGQLVPAWRLVNGVSITQTSEVDAVTYFHVELHQHDILLANGASAESFLDETGFRGQFQNAAEFAALYPDELPQIPLQPRLEDGLALQLVRERLADRAGIMLNFEPVGSLRGFIDQAEPETVCGWAQHVDSPEEPVVLEILIDGVPVVSVLANAYRADLRQAGLGSGCHAFAISLPVTGVVAVRRVTDGMHLGLTDAAAESLAA